MPIVSNGVSVSAGKTVRSKFTSVASVQAAMLEKLKHSGLDAKDAQRLKLQALTAVQCAALDSLPVYRAGFRIPYFDLQGKPTTFFRFRYLEGAEVQSGFNALVSITAKQLRYAQPAKSLNEVYLPPLAPWPVIARDTAIPIFITEGEIKAACACKEGLACMGLGGVWCFKSKAQTLPLLPAFNWIDWKDRIVYIVYDSDAMTNPNVVQAENALARELFKTLGAVPYIVRLPSLASEAKTGLDDYIVDRGVEAFQSDIVVHNAVEFAAAQELLTLNEEVLYVEDPGLIVRLDTLQRLSCRAFTDHAYSDRVYYEHKIGKDDEVKVTEKSAPREWLKWKHRSKVVRATYLPGADRVVAGSFNCWPGWGVQPAVTSSPSTIRPWLELLDYLFSGIDHAARTWFEQWLAYPLQHPGFKLYSAAVMWGLLQGTGKTLVGTTMFKIYGSNATEIGDRDLYSTHNEWAEHKQFVMADEITGGDKRNTADRMKSMITQKAIRLNPKYVPSYTVPDCINYYFTSNHPDAFFLEDADRRFFVHEVRSTEPKTEEFYKGYIQWLDTGGASYLFHHLLNLDLTGFNPSAHAPTTQSKKDMIDAGKSDLGQWCQRLKLEPDRVLRLGDLKLKHTLFTSEELRALYDPDGKTKVTTNGMARELRRSGLVQANQGASVRTEISGHQRLWVLRGDIAKLVKMKPAEVGALYDRERAIGVKNVKKEKF